MTRKADIAPVIYAIGDVHGEAARLKRLHGLIFERHQILWPNHPIQIVHLGDYVDRGADSAGVIELLLELEQRSDVVSVMLQGNHEALMSDGLANINPTAYETWLVNGGEQTLNSYRARGYKSVPEKHRLWIQGLPKIHVEQDLKLIFVHAGIHPIDYPNDREEVYLWTRSQRFFDVETWENNALEGWTVIHGHTPTEDSYPDNCAARSRRINVDTGAVFGGRLTSAIFAPGEEVQFIYA